MEYIEGEGFRLTEGDSWKTESIVLQFVNPQGAWMDEVSIIKNSSLTNNDILDMISKYVPHNQPYRILKRESVETIAKILD